MSGTPCAHIAGGRRENLDMRRLMFVDPYRLEVS